VDTLSLRKKDNIEPNKDHLLTVPICHGIGVSCGGLFVWLFTGENI
jgi:hypothetical protein